MSKEYKKQCIICKDIVQIVYREGDSSYENTWVSGRKIIKP